MKKAAANRSKQSTVVAIEALWKCQRDYRQSRDGRIAYKAIQIARQAGFDLPPWVLGFLDSVAERVLRTKDMNDIGRVLLGDESGPSSDNDRVARAFGFMPGDFDLQYDDAMFALHDKLTGRKRFSQGLSEDARAYFRSEGSRGGKIGSQTMTPAQRKARATKASKAAAIARAKKKGAKSGTAAAVR